MKPVPSKDKPLEARPYCIRCRRVMCRNRKQWFCTRCPKSFVQSHSVANSRRGIQTRKSNKPIEERPCCVRCRRQMCRHTTGFICVDCRVTIKAHLVNKLNSDNPYCLKCKVQTCSASRPTQKRFQCHVCKMSVSAQSTYHGQLSVLPWCIYCRRMMQRASGTALAGGGDIGAFRCGRCRAYTLENPVRYRPRPSWRAARIMRLVESYLPTWLDIETHQEARAALLCAILTGELKQSSLSPAMVRRYVSRARVTRYSDVALDAVLPSGSRRIDFLVG
jgi:hypothetical protein